MFFYIKLHSVNEFSFFLNHSIKSSYDRIVVTKIKLISFHSLHQNDDQDMKKAESKYFTGNSWIILYNWNE